MRQRLLAGLVGFALAGGSHSALAQTSPPTSPPQASTPPVSTPKLDLTIGQSTPVELLVVGAQPTEKFRLRPVPGRRQQLALTWQIQTQVKVGEQAIPSIQMPTMTATLESTVNQVDPNGDIHYAIVYRQIDVQNDGNLPPALAAQFKTQLQPLEGLTGNYVITEFGAPRSVQMTFPETMTPLQQSMLNQFSQSVTNLSAPLPNQPIGISAKWRQTTPIVVNGATVNQTTIYELTNRQSGIATIKLQIEQTANGQTLQSGLPGMGDLTIKSLRMIGSGQMVWDSQQPLPDRSTIEMNANLVSQPSTSPSGQAIPTIVSNSTVKLEIQPTNRPQPAQQSTSPAR
jgi:hypothetical protein